MANLGNVTKKLRFLPQDPNKGYTSEDREISFSPRMQPMARLPRSLVPTSKSPLQPPRFHYGWLINVDHVYEWAKAHGHVRFYEEMEDDVESSKELTLFRSVYDVCKSLGVPFPRGLSVVPVQTPDGHPYLVSITTNYIQEMPPSDVRDALRDFYTGGRAGPGQWWLDVYHWVWKRQAVRRPKKKKSVAKP
ncbi:hypothetical protein BV22DRAFT_1034162 [Leucogyrophana mollusca]|uniref:Uncharacterized protein n=1 Tax=Leucogyrophana mollusca TaxID=85980 RepID=A0ACB8BIF4_9AGAM|nr:hypothetical protein BV22DRAFT_1034162 [Leucogyrophana mollusca]